MYFSGVTWRVNPSGVVEYIGTVTVDNSYGRESPYTDWDDSAYLVNPSGDVGYGNGGINGVGDISYGK